MAKPWTSKSSTAVVAKLQDIVNESMTRLAEPLQAAVDTQAANARSLQGVVAAQQSKIKELERMIAAHEKKLRQISEVDNVHFCAPDSDDLLERCEIGVLVKSNTKGFRGLVNDVPARFWISSSSHSFIRADVAARAGARFLTRVPMICKERYGGSQYKTKGTVEVLCSMQETYQSTLSLVVLEELKAFDVVLGNDWLRKVGSIQYLDNPSRVVIPHENRMVALIHEDAEEEKEGIDDEDEVDDGCTPEDEQYLESCILSVAVVKVEGYRGLVKNIPATFFFSSGSTHSFINADVAARAGLAFVSRTPKVCELRFGNNKYITEGTVEAAFSIQGTYAATFQFEVLKELKLFDVVLGADWGNLIDHIEFLGNPSRIRFPHEGKMVALVYELLQTDNGEEVSKGIPLDVSDNCVPNVAVAEDTHEDQTDKECCSLSVAVTGEVKGFRGLVNDVPATFLFSLGSTHSFIKGDIAARAGLAFLSRTQRACEDLYGGNQYRTQGMVDAAFSIQGAYRDTFRFQVLKELEGCDVVLGADWANKFPKLDSMNNPRRMVFDHEGRRVELTVESIKEDGGEELSGENSLVDAENVAPDISVVDAESGAPSVLILNHAKGYKVQGQVHDVSATFSISPQSTHSFINPEFVRRAGLRLISAVPKMCEIPGVGGNYKTQGKVQADISIQKYKATVQLEVVEELKAVDVVLGSDWTSGLEELLIANRRVSFRHQGRMVGLKCQGTGVN